MLFKIWNLINHYLDHKIIFYYIEPYPDSEDYDY